MMNAADLVDPFVHNVAVKLSHAQNTINPNDLLARSVIDIAKSQSRLAFVKAAGTFGKFQQQFLEDLHDEIASHVQQQKTGLVAQPVQDFNVIDSDVLALGPVRRGGLVRPDSQHTFKQSAKPLEPPTPRTSVLGLDRLAMQKRAERAAEADNIRKRPRDDYKHGNTFKAPRVPDGRNVRRRGEETPSHPGGLSEQAAARLADHRRNRERQKDGVSVAYERNDEVPRGLGDFQRRANRDEIRRNERDQRSNSWDSTPRNDAPSMRVPNVGWESTPRDSSGAGSWGGARNRQWDAPTPRVSRDGGADEDGRGITEREWEEEQTRLDHDWYTTSESGALAGDEDFALLAQFEALELHQQSKTAAKQTKRVSARQAQYNKDNDLWEANRMMTRTSGVTSRAALDLSAMDDDAESTVHVIVRNLKPPFLDGRTVYTKQLEPINPIRDPTSNMAIFSKKGSALVKQKREQARWHKAAAKMAFLSGRQLGNIMGVRDEDKDAEVFLAAAAEQAKVEGKEDYKGDLKFASHLKTNIAMSTFAKSRTLKEQRESLPVFACREEILSHIRENQIVVVVGETGSGKTTQLGQFLYEDGYCAHGALIACTQPRRVAAMSVAKRVSEEMECNLAGTVGYSIRFEDCTSDETRIKFMTDGILLWESLYEGDLDRYSVIILDEAHERSLDTDILMGLLKKILSRRRDLKLIVTSATMVAEKFSRFYGNAPIFTIPGRTFPVEITHSRSPCEDYVDGAVKQILQIHLFQPMGDILVFMTGQEDIEITCQVVNERLSQLDDPTPIAVLPIYSQMPADLQAKIFEPTSDGRRKVIVATNIAETSLTVDGILYVVDSGYSKLKFYNAKVGMDSLLVTPISQENANQRAGRVGRTNIGYCYRLYTEAAFQKEMFANSIPEIQRTNLINTVLLLKSLGVKNLLEFDFIDPPPQSTILNSMYQLWVLGALDNVGDLTPTGRKMSDFPMEPSMAKMLIVSVDYKCSAEMLTIVAMLSVPSVFYRPKERMEEADAAKEKFQVAESDHLTLLNVFNQWKSHQYRDEWAMRHFLHPKTLRKAREVRTQLEDIMDFQKLPIISSGMAEDTIRKAITAGYFHQACRVKGIGEFVNIRSGIPTYLHPTSALYGLGYTPTYVIYHELVLTSKDYITTVTAIDPYWLAELGSVFYSVKEKNFDDASGSRRRVAKEFSKQAELEVELAKQREETARQAAEVATPSSVRGAASKIIVPGTSRNAHGATPRRRLGGV